MSRVTSWPSACHRGDRQRAHTSAGPAVGEGEIVLPPAAVGGFLPGTADGVQVLAEGAGETLPEIQRREVGPPARR
jgi:hypothetical protein